MGLQTKKERIRHSLTCSFHLCFWWSWTGSNRRPHECHSCALPTELQPRIFLDDNKRSYPCQYHIDMLAANPVILKNLECRSGEIGRRAGLKIQWYLVPCRFDSDLRHHFILNLLRTPLHFSLTYRALYDRGFGIGFLMFPTAENIDNSSRSSNNC